MKHLWIGLILSFMLPSFGGAASSPCVGQEFSSPMAMFQEAYQSSRLLGWGLTVHVNYYEGSKALGLFLEQVGHDENLKYIFVELPAELAPLMEKMSLGQATSSDYQSANVYYDRLTSDTINHQTTADAHYVFPKVAELNKTRRNKLIIVPIDSLQMPDGTKRHFDLSLDREKDTVKNFEKYYQKMAANEKAIILYHTFHMLRNIEGNTKTDVDNNEYNSPKGEVSFLGLANINDDEFKMIVFDTPKGDYDRLFLSQATQKSEAPYRVSPRATADQCLKRGNFIRAFTRNALFMTPLSQSIAYVVPDSQSLALTVSPATATKVLPANIQAPVRVKKTVTGF